MEKEETKRYILISVLVIAIIASAFYGIKMWKKDMAEFSYEVETFDNNGTEYTILVPIPTNLSITKNIKEKSGDFDTSVDYLLVNGTKRPFLNITSDDEIRIFYKVKMTKKEYFNSNTSFNWAHFEKQPDDNEVARVFSLHGNRVDVNVHYTQDLGGHSSVTYDITGAIYKKGWNHLNLEESMP